MKKSLLSFIFFLFCTSVFANPINKIVFFGDSLSDNGNLYKLFLKIIPKSPPYYRGRFSNGPTWAESLTKNLYDKYYIDSENYAYGGATAIFHMPSTKFIAPTFLPLEVNDYLIWNLLKYKGDTLFAIWIGANDYIYSDEYPKTLTDAVVDSTISNIKRLISYGATNFVVMNLPDLSHTPYAKIHNIETRLHGLSVMHNEKLKNQIDKLRKENPNVKFIYLDMFALLNDLMNDPKKYNKIYNVNITNTKDSCWLGGYMYKNMTSARELNKEIQDAILHEKADRQLLNKITLISDQIMNNPMLAEAYQSGKAYENGVRPCDNADGYVFWDDMHPTAIVHNVLGKMVAAEVIKTFM